MWKRALVSVSDKSGLIDFLKPLQEEGLEIVSTGGTAEHLRQAGLKIKDVSEVTGFPEILDGRVKTLHPHVHMGLLARPDENSHIQTMNKFSVNFFDLVVVNLYPFEQAFQRGAEGRALIEKIDVGGPSMLRAAAKNFEFITVVTDPKDYGGLLKAGGSDLARRRQLAAQVFSHLSYYDGLIARALSDHSAVSWAGQEVQALRYGENPQQKAHWYRKSSSAMGLHSAQVLQGKELSYNNLLDLEAALGLCAKFSAAAVVAVKHNNPCGVAVDEDPLRATVKALTSDPVSVYGGIVALNRPVNKSMAEELNKIFLECVLAPDFDEEALVVFGKRKNLRLLRLPKELFSKVLEEKEEVRSVFGGFLVQTPNRGYSETAGWQFLSEKPSESLRMDLEFGERVCASLKSNSIAVVGDQQTLGMGMGQVNRVDAVAQALERYQRFHPNKAGVLVSDAFFPFSDSIEKIAAAGIKWVLQPGGSVRDEEVFAKARELGVNLVITGQRHFKH